MQGWQTPYLGLRDLPHELTEFESAGLLQLQSCRVRTDRAPARRQTKLGLRTAYIGFVRMSGRPLNSVRGPARVAASPGPDAGITTPDLASLRALYARGRTLFDHQQQACEALGFA